MDTTYPHTRTPLLHPRLARFDPSMRPRVPTSRAT
jgi:hypothetical protein